MIFLNEIVDGVYQLKHLYTQSVVDIEHQLQYNKQEIDLIVLYMDPNHNDVPMNHDVMNDILLKSFQHLFEDENQDLKYQKINLKEKPFVLFLLFTWIWS
jgi:hypothetical protein